ncbi:uncharacterized protein [Anas acuta]|uniref:uncharacterized protein n=1 Tax=Anas acuta TaxID=28680 RepID=UPI0035C8F0CD
MGVAMECEALPSGHTLTFLSFSIKKVRKLGKSAFVYPMFSHKQQSDGKFSLLILLCFCFPFPVERAVELDEYRAKDAQQSARLKDLTEELVRKNIECSEYPPPQQNPMGSSDGMRRSPL